MESRMQKRKLAMICWPHNACHVARLLLNGSLKASEYAYSGGTIVEWYQYHMGFPHRQPALQYILRGCTYTNQVPRDENVGNEYFYRGCCHSATSIQQRWYLNEQHYSVRGSVDYAILRVWDTEEEERVLGLPILLFIVLDESDAFRFKDGSFAKARCASS